MGIKFSSYLTEPHSLRLAVQEPDHGVLPVSHMIVDISAKNRRPVVEGVEVHVKRIDMSTSVIIHDNSRTYSSIRFPRGIWLDPFQPCWFGGDIVYRRKVDVRPGSIQRVQIV